MSNVFRITSAPPPNFNPEDYKINIKYYLDSEVSARIATLHPDELESFFEMAHVYHSLYAKIYLMPGDALVNYIVYGHEFYEALKDPHEGIDYTPSYIVHKYKEWAERKGYPIPVDMVAQEGIDTTPMTNFQQNLQNP